jgi:hypothetical protein
VLAALLSAVAMPMWAAGNPSPEARQRYEAERARCMSGESRQDRATCLREAGAALDESRRGGLATPRGALSDNAVARCDAQPPADRAACVARIQGAGKTQGSVEGGGVIRETETKVQ